MDLTNEALTIIMADDDPDDRFLAEVALREIGFSGSLKFAEDGEELLRYLKKCFRDYGKIDSELPDLILLDLNMPVKNGWETLQEIKRLQEFQHIPVVIWSTSDDDEERLKCIDMGADYFITKPYEYSQLISNIRFLVRLFCSDNKKMRQKQ